MIVDAGSRDITAPRGFARVRTVLQPLSWHNARLPIPFQSGIEDQCSVWVSAQISTRTGTHSGADPSRKEAPRSRSAFREDSPVAKSNPASTRARAVRRSRHSLLPTREARMRLRTRARSCAHTQTHADSRAVCLVRVCVCTRMGKGSGKGAGRGGERERR